MSNNNLTGTNNLEDSPTPSAATLTATTSGWVITADGSTLNRLSIIPDAYTRFFTHATTLAGASTHTAMLDGRKHLVVPVVALVAGVVNGLLIEPEELRKFADAWNGRPIPLRHPKQDGDYVSANSPDIIERQVIGQFFNAHITDGHKLVGELWLDIGKCEQLGGDALATLRRLEDGQPVEVSTAYFCDVAPFIGNHNGDPYTGIQRNLRPDHLALLPDEVGACSWQDGCGAPRVNSEQPATNGCNCPNKEMESMEVEELKATAEVTANEEEAEATSPDVEIEAEITLTDELASLAQLVKELGGVDKVAAALRNVTANAESRKAELVGTLKANTACAFTEADLQAMQVDQLEKLQRSLTPASYAGRPAANAASLKEGEFLIGSEVYRPYRPVTAKQ